MPYKTNKTIQIKGFPLIKFQSSDKIQKIQQGTLYMKNLEYYRNLEKTTGNSSVGDLFEAMLHINQAKLIIPELSEEIEVIDGLMPTNFSNSFAFCMFGVNTKFKIFKFTDEQKNEICSFGDTALLITDKDEFFRRIFVAVEQAGLMGYHGFVKYYNEHIDSVNLLASLINGMENIAFWKRDKYHYQQEYRFLVQMKETTADHLELNIGNICDISRTMKTSVLLNSMAIQHTQE